MNSRLCDTKTIQMYILDSLCSMTCVMGNINRVTITNQFGNNCIINHSNHLTDHKQQSIAFLVLNSQVKQYRDSSQIFTQNHCMHIKTKTISWLITSVQPFCPNNKCFKLSLMWNRDPITETGGRNESGKSFTLKDMFIQSVMRRLFDRQHMPISLWMSLSLSLMTWSCWNLNVTVLQTEKLSPVCRSLVWFNRLKNQSLKQVNELMDEGIVESTNKWVNQIKSLIYLCIVL